MSYVNTNGVVFPKSLSWEQQLELFQRKEKGEQSVREELIECNLRLVFYFVQKFHSDSIDDDDLFSVGCLGLIKAVDSFQCEKGIKFSTYASKVISNEILMYLRSSLKNSRNINLNTPYVNSDFDLCYFQDFLPDSSVDIEAAYIAYEERIQVREMLDLLPKNAKNILILYFGFDGNSPHTQQDIAFILGYSQSYVSRLLKKYLERLKFMMEGNGISVNRLKKRIKD